MRFIRARLLAERNYKLAVPQFWRETGEIQFLLPIYLGEMEEADKPQCALALALDTSGRMPYLPGCDDPDAGYGLQQCQIDCQAGYILAQFHGIKEKILNKGAGYGQGRHRLLWRLLRDMPGK